MAFINGIKYNFKGLFLALKTPSLLLLGLLRFVIIMAVFLFMSGLVLVWHNEILNLIWTMPDGGWLVYVWNIVSWFLVVILTAVAMLMSYIVAQIFFCVFIMDYMSRITERIHVGMEKGAGDESWIGLFIYLMKQEIPRAIIPLFISLFIALVGLLTPLGPVFIVVSSMAAALFLAWDHTDLIYARRMIPFRERLGFLKQNLGFHLGFGLLFLIPWLNILFLSYAPVGATLFILDREGSVK
ncbi:MAG: EI24 domain-containing protein [Desulfobacterales bacterium]|nr:EI24 domain-containing protein [Desulfobacterales bacterium]